ncbi:hypothetical protein GCM10010185_13610 [Saccharothrix coeruleofusca]|uniref:Uncharacterized protein n=1 Tax=Saccharothrix coeruleofusca TaxID=33919 RepID=A0A918AIY4_9PSEU|nr:hypothetical protein GCM10010185_13610 [Saccharothrix coeruleofusca]
MRSRTTRPAPATRMTVPSSATAEALKSVHVQSGAGSNHVIVHIACLHALGSIGAAHHITSTVADLFSEFGDSEFSMAVTTKFDGLTPETPKVLVPPRKWA